MNDFNFGNNIIQLILNLVTNQISLEMDKCSAQD